MESNHLVAIVVEQADKTMAGTRNCVRRATFRQNGVAIYLPEGMQAVEYAEAGIFCTSFRVPSNARNAHSVGTPTMWDPMFHAGPPTRPRDESQHQLDHPQAN